LLLIPAARAQSDPRAEAVVKKAVDSLGGQKYLNVRTLYSTGRFSIIRDGMIVSFQTFVDVIVYPDKERTEFKGGGVKTIQTNSGDAGWIYDGSAGVINLQSEKQVADFKRGMQVSVDNLLRGHWRGKAKLEYAGRREATLGTRNDVVRLVFDDGMKVEYEFAANGLPVKAIYGKTNPEGEETREEDRYAQFVDVDGIKAPFIVDHFSNGQPTSRINYTTIEFNRNVPDSIFSKPATVKEAKKDLKL
jgi:hypothetical protein